ncbi:hypothetical protein ARMSODRAFT_121689 [Armillaria solidipes]|uniref:Secreted protein n=1 Tax=Armillaria solidipes TaxID=1076256 RepID=A0A2H3BK01_9AGAR|nr:hypothetical protein ARMSODRAFT_121689 [Armillaria solidipes]
MWRGPLLPWILLGCQTTNVTVYELTLLYQLVDRTIVHGHNGRDRACHWRRSITGAGVKVQNAVVIFKSFVQIGCAYRGGGVVPPWEGGRKTICRSIGTI